MAGDKKYYTEAHAKAQTTYDKNNMVHVGLKLHVNLDNDVISKLKTVDSKQGYIKQLVRDDIKRTGFQVPPSPKEQKEQRKREEQEAYDREWDRQYAENVERIKQEKAEARRMLGLEPEE